eukprot:2395312-Alexandrium_andersonii.AAC.1
MPRQKPISGSLQYHLVRHPPPSSPLATFSSEFRPLANLTFVLYLNQSTPPDVTPQQRTTPTHNTNTTPPHPPTPHIILHTALRTELDRPTDN